MTEDAARQLAWLLRERGDLDEAEQILRARADAGDWYAARQLARLLRERGEVRRGHPGPACPGRGGRQETALRSWSGCCASTATWTGCVPWPTLATQTPPSSWPELLRERGDLDEAEQILRRPGRRLRLVCRAAAGRAAPRARGPGRAACPGRHWRARRSRPTGRADDRARSERRGEEVASVRLESRRVNCLCVTAERSGPCSRGRSGI